MISLLFMTLLDRQKQRRFLLSLLFMTLAVSLVQLLLLPSESNLVGSSPFCGEQPLWPLELFSVRARSLCLRSSLAGWSLGM